MALWRPTNSRSQPSPWASSQFCGYLMLDFIGIIQLPWLTANIWSHLYSIPIDIHQTYPKIHEIPSKIHSNLCYIHCINIHKHPGGPETVLVKARLFKRMSLTLWRNANFVSDDPPKNRYHNVGGVRVLLLIFIGGFFLWSLKNSIFFIRKCVSMLQSSSAASWHCGLCTSIAKILRHKSRQRRCKLSLKSRQRSWNLKEKITT